MAKQILRMCPRAQLYILRLEDYPAEDGGRQIDATSAAQAIHAAIKKGVHIISMSWTIDPPADDNVRSQLEKAIQAAANENILMFCAASDKGANHNESYPSKAHTNIFKIGAAKPDGHPDSWVNVNNVNFILPGSDRIDSHIIATNGVPVTKEVSGSSVATALAAGLAALILYCAQIRIFVAGTDEHQKAKDQEIFNKLKKHEHMMTAFHNIGLTKDKFLTVWQVFGHAADQRALAEDNLLGLVSGVVLTLSTRTGLSTGYRSI